MCTAAVLLKNIWAISTGKSAVWDWERDITLIRTSPCKTPSHPAADLRKYFMESLAALQCKKLDLWYLHAPDRSTPFEETFKATD
jgi:aflatoxin B1 aldehyde reductase